MPNTALQHIANDTTRSLAATLDTPGGRAIMAITPPAFCSASTLAVQVLGDPACEHQFRTSRVDDYAWWRCVKCPCEVGCEIPLPF